MKEKFNLQMAIAIAIAIVNVIVIVIVIVISFAEDLLKIFEHKDMQHVNIFII